MKQMTLRNYNSINEFIEAVENADTWDAISLEDYREAVEKVGLDYDSYDDPDEMWNDFLERVEANKTWSVETEGNDWNDDLFNGSLEECIEYCKDKNINVDGSNARIAKICLDENGSVDFWEELVDDLDSVECKDFLMDEQL